MGRRREEIDGKGEDLGSCDRMHGKRGSRKGAKTQRDEKKIAGAEKSAKGRGREH